MIAVFGNGVSSRFYQTANPNAHVFTCSLDGSFYSSLGKSKGLSQYWHQGMMSPGLDYLEMFKISENVAIKFNKLVGLPLDFHKFKYTMKILSHSPDYWSTPSTHIGNIISVDREGSGYRIISSTQNLFVKKIILALSTFGNLAFLSKCSFIDKSILNNNYFNDHIMSICDLDLNTSYNDQQWYSDTNYICQKRGKFINRKLSLSHKVDLLLIPYIGKYLYGFMSPIYTFDLLCQFFLGKKYMYEFKLVTPQVPMFRYGDSCLKRPNVLAFHTLGSSSFQYLNSFPNIEILSGNFLPLNYELFPTYLIGLYSYNKGLIDYV